MRHSHPLRLAVGAAVAIVVGLTSGCQWRTTEQEIIEVDGERFVCTYTLNNISGNQSESVCTPIGGDS